MQTIRRQCSAGSQPHPHIHAFGSQTIRKLFGLHVCTRLEGLSAATAALDISIHIHVYQCHHQLTTMQDEFC